MWWSTMVMKAEPSRRLPDALSFPWRCGWLNELLPWDTRLHLLLLQFLQNALQQIQVMNLKPRHFRRHVCRFVTPWR